MPQQNINSETKQIAKLQILKLAITILFVHQRQIDLQHTILKYSTYEKSFRTRLTVN